MELENLNNKPSGNKIIWAYIAAGIIVIIVLLAFFVYWPKKINPNGGPEIGSVLPSGQEADISALSDQSSSDSVLDIEKDLNATDLDSLDSDLQNIDNSLK